MARWLRRLRGADHFHPVVARQDSRAALSLDYLTFRDLTTANDGLLEIVADLERKLEGRTPFGMAYLRSRAVVSATHAYRMITCLDKLSSRRYQELHFVFAAIQKRVEAVFDRNRPRAEAAPRLVYPLSAVEASMAERVGGKSAHAGEVRNRIRLPAPNGFAVSTDAFRLFLSGGDLLGTIRSLQLHLDPDDSAGLHEISAQLQDLVRSADVPPELAAAVLAAYDELVETCGATRVSVRSSAVGEDGEISFAGQYTSELNVDRAQLLAAYREVVASWFSPRALFYRSVHGIPDDDVPMGVLCMAMVESDASGVACSVDPNRPDDGVLVIGGAWGLGAGPVGGSVSPDTWVVDRRKPLRVLTSRLGWKESRVEPVAAGDVATVPIPPEDRDRFCLSESQVVELSALVLQVEAHYGRPQEVEWAVDREGRFFVLQCRPLRTATEPRARPDVGAAIDGHPALLVGAAASGGCGSGPVFRLAVGDDTTSFPAGAVLVTRHSSPQFVKIMERAAAIVTDIGATTGHMASLAREFHVPAVLDARTATSVLEEGRIVTVDGDAGVVYEGRVDRLLANGGVSRERTVVGTPIFGLLKDLADQIVPLTLTNPRSPDFRPSGCRSFHDIARFIHEKAFEEMFRLSDRVTAASRTSTRLDERLPFLVYLIDIGDGLRGAPGPTVRLADIRSEPMRALLQGMMRPELRWWEPRPISFSGFLSVATESMLSPEGLDGQRRLGDRSYAILAASYCNFSSRVGYHFAAVDAHCADSLSRNYISFRFKGGAADVGRRERRCDLIGEILRRLDFQIERNGDLVNARLRKFPRDAVLSRLDQLGRLIVATRQLDMRLGPGVPLSWFADAFFNGNYLFDPEYVPSEGRGGAPRPDRR